MEWWLVLLIIFSFLIVVMLSGLPIAFCFMLLNIIGVYIFWGGEVGLSQLILSVFTSLGRFTLMPVPMFVLLGEVMFHSGMGLNMIDVLDKWLGRLPGRLGLLAVASATMFSTMSGSTMATTAMLGTLLTPEMEKRGYKKPMSIGPIMGSGGLAMLIPPSGLAVLLAAVAEISIGRLLIAGIIPGLVIAFFYASYVIFRCWLQPSIAPSYEVPSTSLAEKLIATVKYVLPLGSIVFVVLGFIFLGIATPTQAAALGAVSCLVLATFYGKLNWDLVKKSVTGTVQVTAMTFMIIGGAVAFSQVLGFSGATKGLLGFVVGLPLAPIILFIAMQAILLILGMFMSAVAIMMISIPIYMPIIYALGFDPIWFGLIMLINMEMAMTTPPFGMLLFVMRGVAPKGTTMVDIYLAGIPFLLCDLSTMLLIIAFPIVALWLPGMM
ncbi:TRAP transporter large permease subunit [Chloroflexota bacterium]